MKWDMCWIKESRLSPVCSWSFPISFFAPSLSASLQSGLLCHVLLGSVDLLSTEWKWQGGTATVPRGTWCPSALAVCEKREPATPKWKPQPKLTMTERTEPQPNPDGDWTLRLVWSGATFTCNTAPTWSEKVPSGTWVCWEYKFLHKERALCKTALILLHSQQVPRVWLRATAQCGEEI